LPIGVTFHGRASSVAWPFWDRARLDHLSDTPLNVVGAHVVAGFERAAQRRPHLPPELLHRFRFGNGGLTVAGFGRAPVRAAEGCSLPPVSPQTAAAAPTLSRLNFVERLASSAKSSSALVDRRVIHVLTMEHGVRKCPSIQLTENFSQ